MPFYQVNIRVCMELGKVHGPYKRSDGKEFVIIVYHNEQGQIIARKTIKYSTYLEEYAKGMHHFADNNKKSILLSPEEKDKRAKQAEFRKNFATTCAFCQVELKPKVYVPTKQYYFCGKNCAAKFNRRQKKKSRITYKCQYVITINEKRGDKYYIIYEKTPGNRKAYLVKASDTQTEVSEDSNQIVNFRLVYDINKADEIRLVRSFKNNFWITRTGVLVSRRTKRILSQFKNEAGYLFHATRYGGRTSQCVNLRLHRLVAEAFVPNPMNKPFVNHLDGNKTNNHYANLEWVTSKENVDHAWSTGLNYTPKRREQMLKQRFSKTSPEQIAELRRLWATGQYRLTDLCRMFNRPKTTIRKILHNETFSSVT